MQLNLLDAVESNREQSGEPGKRPRDITWHLGGDRPEANEAKQAADQGPGQCGAGRCEAARAGHERSCTPTGSYDKRDVDAPRSDDPGAWGFAGQQIAIAGDPGGPGVGRGLRRLGNALPTGVCDYRKPGVAQQPSVPWMTFADGPGGQPLGTAPESVPFKC